ncbi:MAG: hypothetical protein JO061_00945, partial [Acidobacteriaceae bacterium]|nr:hypothetical protein [Acidobacteriaceae bacterium]
MAGVCIAAPPLAAASSRIHARIEQDHDFVLRGNVHPLASPDYDQGEADPSLELPHITVHFAMTPEQASDLQNLLRAQQDPANANYHQWLAPEEFADRFGLGHSDLRRIVDWLHAIG